MVSCDVQLSAPELAVEACRSACEPFLEAMVSLRGAARCAAHCAAGPAGGMRPEVGGAGVAVASARDWAIRSRGRVLGRRQGRARRISGAVRIGLVARRVMGVLPADCGDGFCRMDWTVSGPGVSVEADRRGLGSAVDGTAEGQRGSLECDGEDFPASGGGWDSFRSGTD